VLSEPADMHHSRQIAHQTTNMKPLGGDGQHLVNLQLQEESKVASSILPFGPSTSQVHEH
jgi:hypothetical protein